MTDLYQTMKERALGLAQMLCWELMADSDNPSQPFFLMHLPTVVPEEKDRQILLDGLAGEYARLEGWMAHIDPECQSTTYKIVGSDLTKRSS